MGFTIIIWIVSMIIGVMIAENKGQNGGLILAVLLGPLGVVIVLCMPNRKKLSATALENLRSEQMIELQRQQLDELRRERQTRLTASFPPPLPPDGAKTYRIAKGGNDLGDMSISAINQMLAAGGLSTEDYYLDPTNNEWVMLAHFPELL